MNKRNRGLVLALVLWTAIAHAYAGTSQAEVRKQVEASMLVQGTIDIDAEGRVVAHQLDQAATLSRAIRDVIERRVNEWRFEPVLIDGKAVRARSPMQLRLVTRQDGENYLLRIAGATFGSVDEEGEMPRSRGKLKRPRYPEAAVNRGVGGTVYLVLRVGRDGAVQEVVAEQVNLRVVANEHEMTVFRDLLARTAMMTARKWLFDVPTRGEDADEPFTSIRVPVDFLLPNQSAEKAGEWNAYVPGPRQPVPWRNWSADFQAPDAIASGGVYPDRPTGPRLLTGLDG